MQSHQSPIKVLVPTGALGIGVNSQHVFQALEKGIDVIACDAGSTDSGPAYLGTGRAKYSRDAIKTDLSILMLAQAAANVPLLIGSCGTSGCDAAVDWTLEIALEIAREHKLTPRIAALYSEQAPDRIAGYARDGRVAALAPMKSSAPSQFERVDRIVALMGPEPYVAALQQGVDIVLGGRTTDTAVLAAVPLMRGAGVAQAWHAGKIAECGALCTEQVREGGVMITVGSDHFDVAPLGPENRCTFRTVSAHMLYENSDPFSLHEPGGVLEVKAARYEEIDARTVRVTGSEFVPRAYTMKLEGVRRAGFQTAMLVGIQDPRVLAEIDRFLVQLHEVLAGRVTETMGLTADDFDISLRPYGWNAVCGSEVQASAAPPREVGLLFVATAATQKIATDIAKTCNPWLFHLPLNAGDAMPSYAFPFSPAELERGEIYEFELNHVVFVDSPLELVRTVITNTKEMLRA